MDVGDAQIPEMRDAGGLTGLQLRVCFRESQELPSVMDPGGCQGGQIPDMELTDYIIGIIAGDNRCPVLLPAMGVRAFQIADHGPIAVDTGGDGVGIASFHDGSVHIYQIGIVDAVQVAAGRGDPGAILVGGHGQPVNQILLPLGSGTIKADFHVLSRGRPQPKKGALPAPSGAQILPFVGIFIFKFHGTVFFVHRILSLLT